MGINLGSRIIADPRFEGVHGMRTADGYMLRMTVAFNVYGYEEPAPPLVVFGPSRVFVNDGGGLYLGLATPEVPQPFRVREGLQNPSSIRLARGLSVGDDAGHGPDHARP